MLILDLAYYIIDSVEPVSPMKLQKLLYYIKVWGLVGKQPVFTEPFEKWAYGPVNPEVYHTFKQFGNVPIPKSNVLYSPPSTEVKKFVDFILECYAPFDAITLSALTHQDEPWVKTPQNKIITDLNIEKYYSTLSFAKNFPLADDKPFYPVETDFHYAYIFDMEEKDVQSLAYPSFKEYKNIMMQSKQLLEQKFSELVPLS